MTGAGHHAEGPLQGPKHSGNVSSSSRPTYVHISKCARSFFVWFRERKKRQAIRQNRNGAQRTNNGEEKEEGNFFDGGEKAQRAFEYLLSRARREPVLLDYSGHLAHGTRR